ncbi:MAG: phosphoglycerate dehydrogenase [Patescibacteria group bacterium]
MSIKKWKILVSAPYFQLVLDKYRDFFDEHEIKLVVPPVNERMSEEELLKYICDIDGVICGDDRFSARVIDAATKLKVISKWGTGIDSIDIVAAKKKGIAVKNTPNAFTKPVADTAMAFILSFARQIPWIDKEMKDGKWKKFCTNSLSERVLGIIGVGKIGQAVARCGKAFGMRIIGNDTNEVPTDFLRETGMILSSLNELVSQADYITIHCDLNPTSFHLIGAPQFALMSNTSYIINTARGPIIDESALIQALSEKKIAGAGLDVFEKEPLPVDSPLLTFPNVLLTPHNANSSPAAWQKVHENTIKNLLEELQKYDK